MERAARRRCNGAITANLPASTEDTPLPAIISRYSDDLTSLLTPALVLVVKVKSTIPHEDEEYWWGAHLPYLGLEPVAG